MKSRVRSASPSIHPTTVAVNNTAYYYCIGIRESCLWLGSLGHAGQTGFCRQTSSTPSRKKLQRSISPSCHLNPPRSVRPRLHKTAQDWADSDAALINHFFLALVSSQSLKMLHEIQHVRCCYGRLVPSGATGFHGINQHAHIERETSL